MMLNTEVLWNKALTDNNVKGIICWLRSLIMEDKCNVKNSLADFNCWLQHSSELTMKELITVCFGQCEGLWMCLDQRSFTKVHLLTQKLENLLSLGCLERKLTGPHPSTNRLSNRRYLVASSSMVKWDCSNQDQQILRQHILLGRLVQWWSLTELLPQYPDAREFKLISQMWRKIDQNHKRVCLELGCDIENKFIWSSLIQDITARFAKHHGPPWVSEDFAYQTYPPPSLKALLSLVLVPHVDITFVQAIIMYFVLDVSNYLRCNDDLLKSFCHTFSIPHSFSLQIRGFWLMDHDFLSDSMELLLSPKASSPWLSLHHHAVLRTLMKRGEQQAALKYLYYTTPVIENIQDARLYMDVLLQNNRVSEALMLLGQGQSGNDRLLKHFVYECESLCVCWETLTTVSKDFFQPHLTKRPDSVGPESINQDNIKHKLNSLEEKDQTPRPLSAWTYQCLSNSSLTPEDFITLFRRTVTDLNSLQTPAKELVVWPEHLEITEDIKHIKNISATHYACHTLPNTPAPEEHQKAFQRSPKLEQPKRQSFVLEVCVSPSVASSGIVSPDTMTSACSFTTSCSSPPAALSETPSPIYSSTETMQSPLPACTHEDCQVLENEMISHEKMAPCCPELTLTVDGATEAMSFKSLRRGSAIELDIYESGVEEMSAVPGNISYLTESPLVETAQIKKGSKSKFNLPSQCYSNEDNQAVSSPAELLVDSHNFLTPEYEKAVYDKVLSEDIVKAENVTESSRILQSEQIDESSYPQHSFSIETLESSSFLELRPLTRALSFPLAEEGFVAFHYDSQNLVDQPEILTSCAPTDTMQDLTMQDLLEQDDLKSREDPCQATSLASQRDSILQTDLIPRMWCTCTYQMHIPLEVSLSSRTSLTHSPELSPSDHARDKFPSEGKTATAKEVACFQTTSDRMSHCSQGSWWKQGLKKRGASTGLLSAVEQIPAATKGHSLSQGSPGSLESSSKPKRGKKEFKQGVKEESTSKRGPCKMGSPPVEPGSSVHAGRRDKRAKQFKLA